MRLHIRHATSYAYTEPARRAVETLRLTPRGSDSQFIVAWRIEVDRDCRLYSAKDAFGNLVHNFTAEGPFQDLSIVAEGTVETTDTEGILGGQRERFPPTFYLRQTELTKTDGQLKQLAHDVGGAGDIDRLSLMHRLMDEIRTRLRFEIDQTDTGTTAVDAFTMGHGVCQDFAHIFVAVARHLGVPARYVGGYLFGDGKSTQAAGHAWAEALIDDLGWVGFDPANGVSPTEAYVRVATGLDYLGAAPVRGTRYGGQGEELAVEITIEKAVR